MAGFSDYLENALQDYLWRGQAAPTLPGSFYVALYTAAPTDAGGGTEVSASGYARVAVARSLANISGTQGAGTTTASSGTGGQVSNNAQIVFGVPAADWGRITHFALLDAATSGNQLGWGALTTPKNVNNGDPAPAFAAGALTIVLD